MGDRVKRVSCKGFNQSHSDGGDCATPAQRCPEHESVADSAKGMKSMSQEVT